MNLLVGFEFEFGWQKLSFRHDFEIFNDVKKDLRATFGAKWVRKIEKITYDGTLKFSNNGCGYTGVEVVTKPMPYEDAIIYCKEMLGWLKNHKRIITNKTCGLHVNMSLKDKVANDKISYYKLLENTPQIDILKLFNRINNSYCRPTSEVKFSLRIKNKDTPRHKISYWLQKANDNHLSTVFKKKHLHMFSKNPHPGVKKTIKFKNGELLKLIKEAYLDRLDMDSKGIAVVEKNLVGNRYFEFRMIGNENYQNKFKEIKKTIGLLKRSLIQSQ